MRVTVVNYFKDLMSGNVTTKLQGKLDVLMMKQTNKKIYRTRKCLGATIHSRSVVFFLCAMLHQLVVRFDLSCAVFATAARVCVLLVVDIQPKRTHSLCATMKDADDHASPFFWSPTLSPAELNPFISWTAHDTSPRYPLLPWSFPVPTSIFS